MQLKIVSSQGDTFSKEGLILASVRQLIEITRTRQATGLAGFFFAPLLVESWKSLIHFRISGGMASTKDLAGHVTANMRKHLAKQKWKVSDFSR